MLVWVAQNVSFVHMEELISFDVHTTSNCTAELGYNDLG